MKYLYIALCVAGTVVPYYFFAPFVLAHGLNMSLFMRQLGSSPVSLFFGADVVMSSIALWAFIAYERRRRPVRLWWLCIIANLGVGVSLALPLFLLLRHNAEPAH
jgi:hypothetical protein